MSENVSIKDKVKEMCQYFTRPFRKKDIIELWNYINPKPINALTLGRYLVYCVNDDIIKLSDWTEGSNNHYIPTKSGLRESILIPMLNPNSEVDKCMIFHTMINPMDLIEISHINRYLPFDNTFAKNEIHKWYSTIDYEYAEKFVQFIGTKSVVIQAFYSDIKDLVSINKVNKKIYADKNEKFSERLLKDEEVKKLTDIYHIKMTYATNMERKLFFTLNGEDNLEIYRKMILLLKFKYNFDMEKIKEYLEQYPQTVTIIIDYADEEKERKELIDKRFNDLNRPESKSMKKFREDMIDLMDLQLKEMKIEKEPEIKKKLENYEILIKEKKTQISRINKEIRIIENEKKEIVDKYE